MRNADDLSFMGRYHGPCLGAGERWRSDCRPNPLKWSSPGALLTGAGGGGGGGGGGGVGSSLYLNATEFCSAY